MALTFLRGFAVAKLYARKYAEYSGELAGYGLVMSRSIFAR
jgi:hypothetical protein